MRRLPLSRYYAVMLLIHPPVALPGEPPAGIARLAGALAAQGIRHRLLDMNLEGQLFLLGRGRTRSDTWTKRAFRNLPRHLAGLRGPDLYRSPARYRRALADIDRVLGSFADGNGPVVGLEDHRHGTLSPLRSRDLLRAAEQPERDPFHPYFSERLTAELENGPWRWIGISLNFLSQALTTFAVAGFVKRRFPGIRIVLGGGLATSWARNGKGIGLFGGLIDRMVAGPGEKEVLALCGVPAAPGPVRPDYSGLPLSEYLSPGVILPYSASSGCWWNRCSFCPEPAEGNPYVPLPPEQVIADLAGLSARHAPVLIHLLDNAVSPAHLKALIAQPPQAPWYGFARVATELADEGYCRELRRSGCVMLKLGLESGDQGVLDALRKGMDLGEASRALRALKAAGIGTYVYLIFGTPAETAASAGRTLAFTAEHSDAIDFLNLAIFNMPVGGEEAGRYAARAFYEGDLSLYTDFEHPAGWDRLSVRRFLDAEFRRHPKIRPVMQRSVPFFGSNHAAFFAGKRF